MDKAAVVAAIRASLATELGAIESLAAMSRDEVGSDESRSESKYDTRSTEASYLARGQAKRIAELRQLDAWFSSVNPQVDVRQIQVGALVELSGRRREWVFVAPAGGDRVTLNGTVVRVISPVSPLGKALLALEAGDGVDVETPQGMAEYEVLSVG